MKLPHGLEKLAARFDALTLRERALTGAAVLVAVAMLWTVAILDPIGAERTMLLSEQAALEQQLAVAQNDPAAAALTLALTKRSELAKALASVDAELESQSAGLIPPERMVQVIRDVLSRQRGVRLVSLHNKPVESLAPASQVEAANATLAPAVPAHVVIDPDTGEAVVPESAPPSAAAAPSEPTGPFVHPVEIIVEGAYLDVLAYLQALEALEWRFYWKVLELETTRYPTNRIRIELSTLSLDKSWIGV